MLNKLNKMNYLLSLPSIKNLKKTINYEKVSPYFNNYNDFSLI